MIVQKKKIQCDGVIWKVYNFQNEGNDDTWKGKLTLNTKIVITHAIDSGESVGGKNKAKIEKYAKSEKTQ